MLFLQHRPIQRPRALTTWPWSPRMFREPVDVDYPEPASTTPTITDFMALIPAVFRQALPHPEETTPKKSNIGTCYEAALATPAPPPKKGAITSPTGTMKAFRSISIRTTFIKVLHRYVRTLFVKIFLSFVDEAQNGNMKGISVDFAGATMKWTLQYAWAHKQTMIALFIDIKSA